MENNSSWESNLQAYFTVQPSWTPLILAVQPAGLAQTNSSAYNLCVVCVWTSQEGGVFTFGAGGYGQLGHNSTNHEINPRKVFELMGNEVTQISCGRWVFILMLSRTLPSWFVASAEVGFFGKSLNWPIFWLLCNCQAAHAGFYTRLW